MQLKATTSYCIFAIAAILNALLCAWNTNIVLAQQQSGGTQNQRSKDSPFKWRPKNVKLKQAKGVLVWYGLGNKESTLAIRLRNGRQMEFLIKAPGYIDGKHWNCTLPPNPPDMVG